MQESIQLIKFKYNDGGYSIKDILEMVKNKMITEENFFEITRLYFNIINEKIGIDN